MMSTAWNLHRCIEYTICIVCTTSYLHIVRAVVQIYHLFYICIINFELPLWVQNIKTINNNKQINFTTSTQGGGEHDVDNECMFTMMCMWRITNAWCAQCEIKLEWGWVSEVTSRPNQTKPQTLNKMSNCTEGGNIRNSCLMFL